MRGEEKVRKAKSKEGPISLECARPSAEEWKKNGGREGWMEV